MDLTRPTPIAAGETNAIGRMLGLLGDEWTLLLLQQSLQGASRYGRLKAALPISNSVLTVRLRVLTDAGLLERSVYQDTPVRAEYLATPRSRSLWPVMLSIWEWEQHWVSDHTTPLPSMHHAACGQDFAPVLTCRSCGKGVVAREVRGDWGPSGSWSRSVPQAVTRRRSDPDTPHTQAGLFPETMTIFGNRWGSALLGAAFRGVTRFTDFEANLSVPPTLLAERLRSFCDLGILEPRPISGRPDWAAYGLTDKGRAFFPVVVTTLRWAEDWFVAAEGPAMVQTHLTCGDPFVPVLACGQCRQPLAGHDIEVIPAGEARDRAGGRT